MVVLHVLLMEVVVVHSVLRCDLQLGEEFTHHVVQLPGDTGFETGAEGPHEGETEGEEKPLLPLIFGLLNFIARFTFDKVFQVVTQTGGNLNWNGRHGFFIF